MKIKGTVYVELTLYLGLGLSILLVWDAVLEQMHHGELLLIAGEFVAWFHVTVLYTILRIFFSFFVTCFLRSLACLWWTFSVISICYGVFLLVLLVVQIARWFCFGAVKE